MDQTRKYQEIAGTPVPVKIDSAQWDSMEELIDLKTNEIDKQDGLVDAKVVMDELHIGKKTLQNMIACGKITRKMYTVAVNGVKKFFINKILGLEK